MVGWSVDCGWVLFLYPSVSVDREDGLTLFGFVKGLFVFDARVGVKVSRHHCGIHGVGS